MSRDIKYIGMDVHQEAVVIAVLNSSGKLVMETIVETKASSILQFLHGLRGESYFLLSFKLLSVVDWILFEPVFIARPADVFPSSRNDARS